MKTNDTNQEHKFIFDNAITDINISSVGASERLLILTKIIKDKFMGAPKRKLANLINDLTPKVEKAGKKPIQDRSREELMQEIFLLKAREFELKRTIEETYKILENSIKRLGSTIEEAPADNEDTPTNNEEVPANNEDTPTNNEEVPANNEDTPINNEEVPANNEDTPTNNEDAPTNNEEAPANNPPQQINALDAKDLPLSALHYRRVTQMLEESNKKRRERAEKLEQEKAGLERKKADLEKQNKQHRQKEEKLEQEKADLEKQNKQHRQKGAAAANETRQKTIQQLITLWKEDKDASETSRYTRKDSKNKRALRLSYWLLEHETVVQSVIKANFMKGTKIQFIGLETRTYVKWIEKYDV